MAPDYRVTWPSCAVPAGDGEQVLQRGDLLPSSVSQAHAAMLESFGAVVRTGDDVEAERSGEQGAAGQGFDPGEHTVSEVIDHVDGDPDRARAVLEAEQAGRDRSTLVEQLTELTE